MFTGLVEEKLMVVTGDTEDRTKSGAASWNRLAPFRSTNIGISAFGAGLQHCDSAEFWFDFTCGQCIWSWSGLEPLAGGRAYMHML
jgi:hypothetical protein